MNVLPTPGVLRSWISPPSEIGQLAADRQSETGAAILAAGAGIGLLEGLEDDLLLLGRDADAGVGHLERHHRGRLGECRVVRTPAAERAVETLSLTPPCSVNLKAFDSRFFSTCCRRFESVTMLRPRLGSSCTSKDRRRPSRLVPERARDHVQQIGEEDLLGIDT